MTRDLASLVAGVDYPRTWIEFVDAFPDEESCVAFLARLRWPDGFVCPRCGKATEPLPTTRNRLTCLECRYEATVTTGTIFHSTKTPLRAWFATVWHVTNQKLGMSAQGLQSIMGYRSDETAWSHLHKLRRAMVRPDRDLLHGVVEVDETYVGGREKGVRGRQTEKKSIVAVAVEVKEPRGIGRVRLQRIENASGKSLKPFIRSVVEPGARVQTDGWKGYNGLSRLGYVHERTVLSSSGNPAHVSMPAVHRVASLVKRWILGTHHGSYSRPQLEYYLDEFTFRFNRRTSRSRGLLFYRLMEQAVVTDPVTNKSLVGGGRSR